LETEDEQIQAIKDWWKNNGRAIIAGLTIGIAAIGGYRFWDNYRTTQAEQASLIYAEVVALSAEEKSYDQAFSQGKQIIENFSGTPYATLTALKLASLAAQKKDYSTARVQLEWVIDHRGGEGFKQVARLRLARVLVAQDKADEALNVLKATAEPGFTTLFNEARGDILVQQGKGKAAADEYRKALTKLEMNPQRRQLLEMKLNDLASGPGKPPSSNTGSGEAKS